MLRPRWYLIQVNLAESQKGKDTGTYFCSFFQKHPSDKAKTDSRNRWWPEWRGLNWLPDNSCYDYGSRVLFGPRNKPNLKQFGKFSEEIDLTCHVTYLLGPLSFKHKDHSTSANSILDETTWITLSEVCEARSISPPTIGPDSTRIAANVLQLRQRLGNSILTDNAALFSSIVLMRKLLIMLP